MKRTEFAELIRLLGEITGLPELDIVGSQSILGSLDDAALPQRATQSLEVDAVLSGHPRMVAVMEQLGLGSLYRDRFGVWVDVVSPTTADFPAGWRGRRIAYRPPGFSRPVAWCPEVTDLAASKAARLDINDREFILALVADGLIAPDLLLARIGALERTGQAKKDRAIAWLQRELGRGER